MKLGFQRGPLARSGRVRLRPWFIRVFASIAFFGSAGNVVPLPVQAQVPLLGSISISTTAGVDALTVEFAGAAPTYQIVKRDAKSYELTFAGARVAPQERVPIRGAVIRAIASQNAVGAVVSVSADMSIALQTTRSGNRFVFAFQLASAAVRSSAAPPPATMPSAGESAEIVFLKYADVAEVLGMLGFESNPSAEASQSSFPQLQGLPPTGTNGGGSLSPQPYAPSVAQFPSGSSGAQHLNEHVAVDRRLNAALLTGTPAEIAAIKARIALFDVPVASITLETKIVELTESAARNVGLSFSSGAVGSAGIQVQSFQKPAFALSVQAQILAQIEKGGGRVIAAPSVDALSGQTASILTGDAIPIVTTITYPGSPPTVQQQIQYINVGVQLQILPRYSSDGYVTSKIASQVSSVTAFLSGNIPQISQRQALTQATVKDGEAYVIGGLIQENEIRRFSKLPILGDIPLLGGLFRSEMSSRQKTSLYIVVTPHVHPATRP